MILRLEHIGIAVQDLKESNPLFESLLGQASYKTETVEGEQVNTAFYSTGTTKVELLEPTGPDSVIQKFIDKRGAGIHHLAFEVDDIEAEIERLKSLGFQFINTEPKNGADNKRIVFLHPKGTNGVLIELCQEITTI